MKLGDAILGADPVHTHMGHVRHWIQICLAVLFGAGIHYGLAEFEEVNEVNRRMSAESSIEDALRGCSGLKDCTERLKRIGLAGGAMSCGSLQALQLSGSKGSFLVVRQETDEIVWIAAD